MNAISSFEMQGCHRNTRRYNGKFEEEKLLGRPKHKYKDNTQMDLREIESEHTE
jgi:hypothetical protein